MMEMSQIWSLNCFYAYEQSSVPMYRLLLGKQQHRAENSWLKEAEKSIEKVSVVSSGTDC